jgi:hypothetical protein
MHRCQMSQPEKTELLIFFFGKGFLAVNDSICLLFDDMVQCSMDLQKNKMKIAEQEFSKNLQIIPSQSTFMPDATPPLSGSA